MRYSILLCAVFVSCILQGYTRLKDGYLFVSILLVVDAFAIGHADNVVNKAFAGLFHWFIFHDDSSVEVNPSWLLLG